MDPFQKNMASRADEVAEEVVASNSVSPSDVESSGMAVKKLPPDEWICQGEEE